MTMQQLTTNSWRQQAKRRFMYVTGNIRHRTKTSPIITFIRKKLHINSRQVSANFTLAPYNLAVKHK